jgi:hypothetical protein
MSSSNYLSVPNPNTTPIYPRVPLTWVATLTTQVTPLSFIPNSIQPVQLGVASESGALLEAASFISMVPFQEEDGGSGSDPLPDGPYGLGTNDDPLYTRWYSRRFGETEFKFVFERELNWNSRTDQGRFEFDILPSPQTAWRLEPYEELWLCLPQA